MKIIFIYILIFIITIPAYAQDNNVNIAPYKVVTVISYSLEKHIDEKDINDKTIFIKSITKNLINRYYFMNFHISDSTVVLNKRAEYINQRIKLFNPNIVNVFGVTAFEYYLLKLVYNKQNLKTIFYCIPDYHFLNFSEKYPNTTFQHGIIQRTNLYDFFSFLKARNVSIDKVVLIRNRRLQDDPISIRVKTATEAEGFSFEVVKVDNVNELKTAIKNYENKNTLLVYGLTFLYDVHDKEMSNYEIAMHIKQTNKTSPEVSLIRNLSRYGVALSYVPYWGIDSVMNPDATCNILYFNSYFNKTPEKIHYMSDLKILVNKDRLNKLGLSEILNNTHDISSIF